MILQGGVRERVEALRYIPQLIIPLYGGYLAFKGEVAFGLTAVHRLSAAENLMLNTGVSYAGDAILVRGGLSWEF